MEHRSLLSGNEAAAWGIRLARPQVMAIYPITPQTPVVTTLAQFIQAGDLACEYIQVESEHSALSVCAGASATGVRAFTATSSQGLAYMNEMVYMTGGMRLPVAMYLVNRSLAMPTSLQSEHNDAMSMRDAGWVQIHCESVQEILDTAIQAYAIGEDERVLLPVVFCADGFILSHAEEAVVLPDQELVDRFLPPYEPRHVRLTKEAPMVVGVTRDENITEHRYRMAMAMENAKAVIEEVGSRFGQAFGRAYGLIDEIAMEDAEIALVTVGSMSSTARIGVERMRQAGKKAGLVRLRVVRPFPHEAIRKALQRCRAVGVVERSTSTGAQGSGGCLLPEIASALYPLANKPTISGFVAGLAGRDLRPEDFESMALTTAEQADDAELGKEVTVTWHALNR